MTDTPDGPKLHPPRGIATDAGTLMAAVAACVHLAGGSVVIPQSVFDLIAGLRLTEEYAPDSDTITLTLTTPDHKEH